MPFELLVFLITTPLIVTRLRPIFDFLGCFVVVCLAFSAVAIAVALLFCRVVISCLAHYSQT